MRAVVLTVALASAAVAQSAAMPRIAFFSIGFKEANEADFIGSPYWTERRTDPSAFLAVTADFNADGRADEARILINGETRIAYVVATIESPTKVDTYVLSQLTLAEAGETGITVAQPLAGNPLPQSAGITIFHLGNGGGESNYFDGEEFNRRVAVQVADKT